MTAWKDLERRVCRALGGQRNGNYGKGGSDCTGTRFAVEIKRSARAGPPVLARWVTQARTQGHKERKPWVLVVAGHHDRHPIAVLDFYTLALILQATDEGGTMNETETTPQPDEPFTIPADPAQLPPDPNAPADQPAADEDEADEQAEG